MPVSKRKLGPVLVSLDWYEVLQAAYIGVQRQVEAIRGGLRDRYGANSDDGWSLHIEGVAGEMAAAKATNCYYNGSVNTFGSNGDVGRWQVRTRSKVGYDLIVRTSDPDKNVFILVVGKIPNFEVVGWIRGADAKQEKWLNDYGGRTPAYFVPRDCLEPMSDIPR